MTNTKTRLSVYVMTGIILLLNIIEIFAKSAALESVSRLFSPLLVIATLVCAYISFKENTLFKSKWTWVAIPIVFTHALSEFARIFTYDFKVSEQIKFSIFAFFAAAGLILILLALIESKFKILLPVGIGVVALVRVINNLFILKSFPLIEILYVASLAGLVLISLNVLPQLHKIIRWAAVIIFAVCSVTSIFYILQWVILAFLLVPAQKIKFNLAKIVAVVCVVTAILSAVTLYNSHPFEFAEYYNSEIEEIKSDIDTYGETSSEYFKEALSEVRDEYFAALFNAANKVIATLLIIAFFVLQAICLFKGNFGKLAYISYASIAAGSLILAFMTTTSFAFWDFDLLNYPIFSFLITPQFWSIVTVASFAAILAKNGEKVVKYRVFAIISAVLMFLASLSVKSLTFSLFTAQYATYFIAMIGIALVMVPLRFTEYNNIAKHIFLTFITCGIWQLIWIYHVTKNLNKTSGVITRKPVVELLLCIFVPFYYIYWTMKTAEYLEKYGEENGKQFKISTLCLALSFVLPFFPTVLIQDKINQIVGIPE